jgi:hypothetical protein
MYIPIEIEEVSKSVVLLIIMGLVAYCYFAKPKEE